MDDFLDNLKNLPNDLRESKKHDSDWMPPTEEYSETFSEDSKPLSSDREERKREAAEILKMTLDEAVAERKAKKEAEAALELSSEVNKELDGVKKTKADRVDMQNYVMDQSKRLAQLAIEAVEGMQGDVINSADGKLAQAYATLIGTASKALDTINSVAQEQSRREHDIEMAEINYQNKVKLAGGKQDAPQQVTNNLNLIASREEMFKMLRDKFKELPGS